MPHITPSAIAQYAYSTTTGHLASITAPDGNTLSYTFDGSLLTRTQWAGAVSGSVGLGYDNDFRVTSENGSAYAYDPDSQL